MSPNDKHRRDFQNYAKAIKMKKAQESDDILINGPFFVKIAHCEEAIMEQNEDNFIRTKFN
ncbi:MAG: hypothetical protein ACKO1U_02810 [Bacteroidota bacterium]